MPLQLRPLSENSEACLYCDIAPIASVSTRLCRACGSNNNDCAFRMLEPLSIGTFRGVHRAVHFQRIAQDSGRTLALAGGKGLIVFQPHELHPRPRKPLLITCSRKIRSSRTVLTHITQVDEITEEELQNKLLEQNPIWPQDVWVGATLPQLAGEFGEALRGLEHRFEHTTQSYAKTARLISVLRKIAKMQQENLRAKEPAVPSPAPRRNRAPRPVAATFTSSAPKGMHAATFQSTARSPALMMGTWDAASFPQWRAASFGAAEDEPEWEAATPSIPATRLHETNKVVTLARPVRRAANFGANNFGAHDYSPLTGLMRKLGHEIPCDTVGKCFQTIHDVMEGAALHPKRFGDQTFIMQTTSSAIINLTEDNFQAGDTIYVVSTVMSGYKGCVIFRRPGSSSNYDADSLLGFVTPDRDPEDLGTATNTLFTSTTLSTPTVVGGTNLVTAKISLQKGETSMFPFAVLPGKLGPVCVGRSADIEIIGAEQHRVAAFTATRPDYIVRNQHPYNSQNSSLVTVPNGYDPTDKKSGPLERNRYVIFGPNSLDGEQSIQSGWADPLIPGGGSSWPVRDLGSRNAYIAWKLDNHVDQLRHLLYGHFHLRVSGIGMGLLPGDVPTAVEHLWEITVFFVDGSIAIGPIGGSQVTAGLVHDMTFDTRGNSVFEAKSGIPIFDIVISWRARTLDDSPVFIQANYIQSPASYVELTWHDVNASQTYLTHILTGAQPGHQLNLVNTTHTEVRPDPTGEKALYLNVTQDLPYDPLYLPAVLQLLANLDATFTDHTDSSTGLQAGAFGQKLKKLFHRLVGVATPIASGLADAYAPGSGTLVSGVGNALTKLTAADFNSPQFVAGSFGQNAAACKPTGLTFPLVAILDDDTYKFTTGEIISGSGKSSAAFQRAFRKELAYKPSNFTGRSGELAMLLAHLQAIGYPVVRGLYSGQVDRVQATKTEASFRLVPVDYVPEKLKGAGSALTAITPKGVLFENEIFEEPASRMFFGALTSFNHRVVPSPENTPGQSFDIAIVR